MSYIDDVVFEYFEHFTTDRPITDKIAKGVMLDMMYDDPVVMEELALILLGEVNWKDIARAINHDTGCS